MSGFNGLGVGLGNLSLLSDARSRSISAENFTGGKGEGGKATTGTGALAARDLGPGWKVSPSVKLKPQSIFTLAEIEGPGAFQHIWFTTPSNKWRQLILRAYWDGEDDNNPSIECPLADFFANGWGKRTNLNSLPMAVNPSGGMNCYWEMPFRKAARLTIENLGSEEVIFYFQIDYTLTEIPQEAAYFHSRWRRSNPLAYREVHTILDKIEGKGHYVGTYLAWQSNSPGWWGEGEIKFYLDGDTDYPTICGTGTEDYFGGAVSFEHPKNEYGVFSTPFLGFHEVIKPNVYSNHNRIGMYRWHIPDPIRFEKNIKVTVQDIGHNGEGHFERSDEICSVAYWYQKLPHQPFPPLPPKEDRWPLW